MIPGVISPGAEVSPSTQRGCDGEDPEYLVVDRRAREVGQAMEAGGRAEGGQGGQHCTLALEVWMRPIVSWFKVMCGINSDAGRR